MYFSRKCPRTIEHNSPVEWVAEFCNEIVKGSCAYHNQLLMNLIQFGGHLVVFLSLLSHEISSFVISVHSLTPPEKSSTRSGRGTLSNKMATDPTTTPVATSTAADAAVAGDAKGAIDFLTLARGLKTTPRTGWVRQEAGPKIESVADHSWRIALMSLVAASSISNNNTHPNNANNGGKSAAPATTTFDVTKCLKMALVHDLAEAQVGDITPHCGVSDDDKHQQELLAMTQMTNHLQSSTSIGLGMAGDEILALWKEYEEGTSMEAQLVKDMDKLEMTLQALEYEQEGKNGKSLDGFFDSTRDKWRTDIGRAWGKEIESRRKQSQANSNDKLANSC
jgi:putative hydrolase of HD superfamily